MGGGIMDNQVIYGEWGRTAYQMMPNNVFKEPIF